MDNQKVGSLGESAKSISPGSQLRGQGNCSLSEGQSVIQYCTSTVFTETIYKTKLSQTI